MGGTFDRYKVTPASRHFRAVTPGARPTKCKQCGRFVRAFKRIDCQKRARFWGFTKTKIDMALDLGVSPQRIADAMNLPRDIVRLYATQRKENGTASGGHAAQQHQLDGKQPDGAAEG